MTLREKLLELNAQDGPNISLRTLAIYCGTTQPTLSMYIKGTRGLSSAKEA